MQLYFSLSLSLLCFINKIYLRQSLGLKHINHYLCYFDISNLASTTILNSIFVIRHKRFKTNIVVDITIIDIIHNGDTFHPCSEPSHVNGIVNFQHESMLWGFIKSFTSMRHKKNWPADQGRENVCRKIWSGIFARRRWPSDLYCPLWF